MTEYRVGQKVLIIAKNLPEKGRIGYITKICPLGFSTEYRIQFSKTEIIYYYEHEFVVIPKGITLDQTQALRSILS